MARPIPLSAPNGTIYTFACGVCHNVEGSVTAFGMVGAPRPEMAEHYREMADACCRCWDCKRILRRDGAFQRCMRCQPSAEARLKEQHAVLAAQDAREKALVDASLVAALDAEAARHLRDALEDLSEEAACMFWYDIVIIGARQAVDGNVTGLNPHGRQGAAILESLQGIRELAMKAGGWWEWPDNQPVATFVPVEKWRQRSAGGAAS